MALVQRLTVLRVTELSHHFSLVYLAVMSIPELVPTQLLLCGHHLLQLLSASPLGPLGSLFSLKTLLS